MNSTLFQILHRSVIILVCFITVRAMGIRCSDILVFHALMFIWIPPDFVRPPSRDFSVLFRMYLFDPLCNVYLDSDLSHRLSHSHSLISDFQNMITYISAPETIHYKTIYKLFLKTIQNNKVKLSKT